MKPFQNWYSLILGRYIANRDKVQTSNGTIKRNRETTEDTTLKSLQLQRIYALALPSKVVQQ